MTQSPAPLFNRLALIGVGLIGSSIARAARAQGAVREIVASARSAATRRRVAELGIADQVVETNAAAVAAPIWSSFALRSAPAATSPRKSGRILKPGAVVSDVGSVKGAILRDMGPHLPAGVHFVPAHPVAGTRIPGPMRDLPNCSSDAGAFSRRLRMPIRRRSINSRRSGPRSAPMSNDAGRAS